MSRFPQDLLKPGIELIETHISWVFLAAFNVWKVKKPVNLGFLDFTTPSKRRQACDAEVRLNRRLASHVYRGVVPVTVNRQGRHHFGGLGRTVDWAVHMARLPDAERCDERLAEDRLPENRLGIEHIDLIAEHLAEFHRQARCDEKTAAYGTAEAIALNVGENFEQTRRLSREVLSPTEAKEIEGWQRRFLAENIELFQKRIEHHRVRDGHGDLRLEHIYLSDAETNGHGTDSNTRVTIIDCIEFNERFRFADVCADIAFLAMDLAWHKRVDLAERLLATYARAGNDYDLYPLVDFYESYRAYVRGKISSILASDPHVDTKTREAAAQQARRYFLLALAAERKPLVRPAVIAVGGLIASGKSTVAERIAREISAPIIDSDRTRKFLLGVRPEDPVHVPAWQGAYTAKATDAVYAEILRRASLVLDSGRAVVLDASFSRRDHRAAAHKLAEDHGVSFRFVECRAERETLKERLHHRAAHPGVSDGRLEILDDFAAQWEPTDELEATALQVLDTSQPLEVSAEILRQRLETWPTGLSH